MSVAVVTGSAGLIGSQAARLFAGNGLDVVGIDNDMRARFFGPEASTAFNRRALEASVRGYAHVDADIRDREAIDRLFRRHGASVAVVVHAAAQPSHDWAARDPRTDFSVNADGTLNLLEATRHHCPDAPFLFVSTNKVYGDTPNRLPLVSGRPAGRWRKTMPTRTRHRRGNEPGRVHAQPVRGVQGRRRPDGAGVRPLLRSQDRLPAGRLPDRARPRRAELHGFLAYLMKCVVEGRPYRVFGYGGKQVRDNIHAHDFATALWAVFRAPRVAAVYNLGGGRHANCSMLEAIALSEDLAGRPLEWTLEAANRPGDHVWWISDVSASAPTTRSGRTATTSDPC